MGTQRVTRASRWWGLSVIINVAFAIGLPLLTNPYRIYPFVATIPGINDIRPKLPLYIGYVRLFDLAHRQFGTVLLGSSRVFIGIDPRHPLLQQYGPTYNAAVYSPSILTIREYFDDVIATQKHVRRILVGLDPYSFNGKFDAPPIFPAGAGKSSWELIEEYPNFAYDVGAMFETLLSSALRLHAKTIADDGRFVSGEETAPANPVPHPTEAAASLATQAPTGNSVTSPSSDRAVVPENSAPATQNIRAEEKTAPPRVQDPLYEPFWVGQKQLEALSDMVKRSQELNIELILFIPSALQPTEWKYLNSIGAWKGFQESRTALAAIHPYWDFNYPNGMTIEPENYVDGSHFSHRVGDKLIERMLSLGSHDDPGIGIYVDAGNVKRVTEEFDRQLQLLR